MFKNTKISNKFENLKIMKNKKIYFKNKKKSK